MPGSDGRQWRCPQLVMSGLRFCDHHYHHVRRNQPNSRDTKSEGLEPATTGKPKRKRRLSADPPPESKRQRGRRLREDGQAEEPNRTTLKREAELETEADGMVQEEVKIGMEAARMVNEASELGMDAALMVPKDEAAMILQEEEAKVEMATAMTEMTRGLILSDHLRCRRSDGWKWRCRQLAMSGLNFCGYHQLRYKQANNKNVMLASSAPAKRKRRRLLAADPRSTKKRRRRMRSRGPAQDEPIRAVRIDEREGETEAGKPELSGIVALRDHLRCRRSDGRHWRCPQMVKPGLNFCKYHQLRYKQYSMKNKKLAANAALARKLLLRRRRKRGDPAAEETLGKTQMRDGEGTTDAVDLEVTRDLPNGVMATSPAPARVWPNATYPFDQKLGYDAVTRGGASGPRTRNGCPWERLGPVWYEDRIIHPE